MSKGLVLGVYEPNEKDGPFIFSPSAKSFDESTAGKLESVLKIAGKKLSCGKVRLLYGLDETYSTVAVANLGKQDAGYDDTEQVDQGKENVRTAVASAVLSLREAGQTDVDIEACGDAEAAAEGAFLSLHSFDDLKQEDKRKPKVNVTLYTKGLGEESKVNAQWSRGQIFASAQNFARWLKENPANLMTPTIFCQEVEKTLGDLPNVKITVREKEWAESMKMGSFLSVTRGSDEPPKFLEIDYQGGKADDPFVAFVGKGVTFDSGGISIKPSSGMDEMRADMGGAAAVVSSIQAAAKLGLPINVKGLVPLCENMPSGKATKPGDVVTAMNGKTIQVDNTDAEGRLILADALCYAETFKPKLILDIATLTGAVVIALGAGATAAYTKSENIWENLHNAGKVTGDRMWRMPLFKHYTKQMTECDLADINNVSKKREAGSCTAAAFLKEFVSTDNWVHLDIAGVMMNKGDVAYMGKGMSGRPTRTLVQFLENLSKQQA
ncbi:cytosol aminopeptidase-like isoform X2 [Physella acuta]|uniref:cytosol aminopeptidase-like isoform X2 n=1 Tax=Physella acuta TaxID=109671 RepID=UPI0027DDB1C3|nr:cytosol aminopeptidase-like isoform X2 [Physella acuta]